MTVAPRASIIIPTHNQRPEFLEAAISSALSQWVPVEVIVVDDGSTDPVVDQRATVIRHETNRGIAAALNTGIDASHADWICWLSSDDAISDRKVDVQLAAMGSCGSLAGFHAYQVIHEGEVGPGALPLGIMLLPLIWNNHREQRVRMASNCYVNGSTTMIHRRVFDEVGPYDTTFRYAQDWEMWNRIAGKHYWHYTPTVLGVRREHDNLTAQKARDPYQNKAAAEEDARVRSMYGGAA